MNTSTSNQSAGDDVGARSAGDEPADPLSAIAGHVKAIWAAAATRLSLSADATMGRVQRLLVQAFVLVVVACLAVLVAALGVYHLVIGSVVALESLLGNRWAPS